MRFYAPSEGNGVRFRARYSVKVTAGLAKAVAASALLLLLLLLLLSKAGCR